MPRFSRDWSSRHNRPRAFARSTVEVGGGVLAQEILAVIVAVGRAYDAVDALARRRIPGLGQADKTPRALMIEFEQDHGPVNEVVVNALGAGAADPGEVR